MSKNADYRIYNGVCYRHKGDIVTLEYDGDILGQVKLGYEALGPYKFGNVYGYRLNKRGKWIVVPEEKDAYNEVLRQTGHLKDFVLRVTNSRQHYWTSSRLDQLIEKRCYRSNEHNLVARLDIDRAAEDKTTLWTEKTGEVVYVDHQDAVRKLQKVIPSVVRVLTIEEADREDRITRSW